MIIVYGVKLSTFTRKVRLALEEKEIPYRLEFAPMGSPKVRSLHPLGKIPIIEDNGTVVPDSSVIVAYLEKTYTALPLYPDSAPDLARCLWLEEYADTRLREATVPFFAENVVKPVYQGNPGDAAVLERIGPVFGSSCDYLERELADRDFFVGNGVTIADIAIATQLITASQGGSVVDPVRWPRLADHLRRMQARNAWAPMLAEEARSLDDARTRRSASG